MLFNEHEENAPNAVKHLQKYIHIVNKIINVVHSVYYTPMKIPVVAVIHTFEKN